MSQIPAYFSKQKYFFHKDGRYGDFTRECARFSRVRVRDCACMSVCKIESLYVCVCERESVSE